jgi:hypothetical protein
MRKLLNSPKTLAILLLITALIWSRLIWDAAFPCHLRGDTSWYYILAKNLTTYGVFGEGFKPDFYWPPGWPFLLSSVNLLFGLRLDSMALLLILSSINILLIWGICRTLELSLFHSIIVSALFIINPSHMLLSNSFHTEHLFSPLFNGFVFVVLLMMRDWFKETKKETRRVPGPSPLLTKQKNVDFITHSCLAGLVLGLAALTRGTALPVALVLLLLVLVSIRKGTLFFIPLRYWMIIIIISLIPVIMWTWRNVKVTGDVIVISANGADNLWLGNNENELSNWVKENSPYRRKFKNLDMLNKYRLWKREAFTFIRKHPVESVLRCGQKMTQLLNPSYYLSFGSTFVNRTRPSGPMIANGINQLIFVSTLIGIICFIIFTYIVPIPYDNLWKRYGVGILLLLAGYWIFLHCITWGNTRFRYPVEHFMWIIAITGFAHLAKARRVWKNKVNPERN